MLTTVDCQIDHDIKYDCLYKDCDVEGLFNHYRHHPAFAPYCNDRIDIEKIKGLYASGRPYGYNNNGFRAEYRMAARLAMFTYVVDVILPYNLGNTKIATIKKSPRFDDFMQYMTPCMDLADPLTMTKFLSKKIHKNLADKKGKTWSSLEGIIAYKLLCAVGVSKNTELSTEQKRIDYPTFADGPRMHIVRVHSERDAETTGSKPTGKRPRNSSATTVTTMDSQPPTVDATPKIPRKRPRNSATTLTATIDNQPPTSQAATVNISRSASPRFFLGAANQNGAPTQFGPASGIDVEGYLRDFGGSNYIP